MQSNEFAKLLTGYAGYLNYNTSGRNGTLRSWVSDINANSSYPIFGSVYPLNKYLPAVGGDESGSGSASDSSSGSDSSSDSNSSESSSVSALPSSSASDVAVSDKNSNPPTGIKISPALSLFAFTSMAIPTAVIAAAAGRKKQ